MAMEAAMALTNRLLPDAQALAAVTAYMRAASEGRALEPDLSRAIVVAFASSYLRQALDIVNEPFRPNTWSHADATILQAQGAASGVVARLVREAGLGHASIRILDIGTGVGGLAIAFCEAFPQSTVVGVDPWEPSLALARNN